jgi:uncharacterized protein YkwD
MLSRRIKIDRRSFIKTAPPFALALPVLMRGHRLFARDDFGPEDMTQARQRLLAMVNRERGQHGLSHLELDNLGCKVAADHARDLIEGMFLSHWGRDGRKPYQRYSFAGGSEATQENAALAHDITTATPDEVEETASQLHQSMFDEVPPNDGHRRTILFPFHTHVGFGIAVKPDHVRLVELYISRYAEIGQMPRYAAPGTQMDFRGKLLNPKHSLEAIHVYYEPLPRPPELAWLRRARSYSLPETYVELWPRLGRGYEYEDGSRGTIEINSRGDFRAPVVLFKQPGINTIVVWIQRTKTEEAFPITQFCIRCE